MLLFVCLSCCSFFIHPRNHVIQGAYRLSSLKASTSPLYSLLNNSLPVVSTSSNEVSHTKSSLCQSLDSRVLTRL